MYGLNSNRATEDDAVDDDDDTWDRKTDEEAAHVTHILNTRNRKEDVREPYFV